MPGINAEYFSGTSYCPGLSRLRPGLLIVASCSRAVIACDTVGVAEGLAGLDGRQCVLLLEGSGKPNLRPPSSQNAVIPGMLLGTWGLQLKVSRCAGFSCRAEQPCMGRTSSPSTATGKTPTGGLGQGLGLQEPFEACLNAWIRRWSAELQSLAELIGFTSLCEIVRMSNRSLQTVSPQVFHGRLDPQCSDQHGPCNR